MKYKRYILDKLPDYDIIDILDQINTLKPRIKERFLKQYALTTTKETREKLTKNESSRNSETLQRIKKRIDKSGKIGRKVPSFFSLFEGYSKENILLAVECLREEEKELLYKKYGRDLSNETQNKNLTTEEINEIRYSITRKIKRILAKLETGYYEIISINDELPYKYDELIEITNKLNESLQYKIYSNFGEDLKKKTIKLKNKPFFTLEEKELIERTYKNKKGKHQTFNTFISQFESIRKVSETDEELLLRIKRNLLKVRNEYQELTYRKYDTDLQNTQNKFNYTKEENQKILRIIIPCIKGFMKREEENLQNELGILKEIKKLLNTSEYKVLESLYGTKYAFSIMYKIYLDDSYKLDGIIELNKEEELLVLLLAKDFLNKKKKQKTIEDIKIKEFIKIK